MKKRHLTFGLLTVLAIMAVLIHFAFFYFSEAYLEAQRGQSAYSEKRYAEAVAHFARAQALKPQPEGIERRYLESLLRQSDFKAAHDLLKNWPYRMDMEIVAAKAGMHDYFGEIDEAIATYAPHLDDVHKQPRLALHYAQLLLRVKRADEAIEELRSLLQSKPNFSEAKQLLASIYSWNHKYDEALELINESLNENPHNSGMRLQRARVLSWTGNFAESAKEYAKLLETTK